MAKVLVSDQYLTNIANAIRAKNGTNNTYTPAQMATAINAIPSGGGTIINNQNKTITPTESQQTITADSGYTGLGTVTVNAVTASYVGSQVPQYGSLDVETEGSIITVPAGYFATTAVTSVMNAMHATPQLLFNGQTGRITASHTQPSGYVVGGTTTDELLINTKGAQTYTPTTTNQIISSGQYLYDDQTILGDSNLVASNIKHDTSIFGVTGTFGTKIDSVTVTPSSRSLTITFTGLKARPLAFVCTQEGQTTFSKSYRWIISVTYDGTTIRNETHGVSGSSMIGYNFTNCTWNYSNGTLTITSPSSGSNGYFKDAMLHRLVYIYEE